MGIILLTECCLKCQSSPYTIAFSPVSIRNKSFTLTVNPICIVILSVIVCLNYCTLTSSRVLLYHCIVLSTAFYRIND